MNETAIVEYLNSNNQPMVAYSTSDHPYEMYFIPWIDIQNQTAKLTHNLVFRPRLLRSHPFSSILIASNGLSTELLSLVTIVVWFHD